MTERHKMSLHVLIRQCVWRLVCGLCAKKQHFHRVTMRNCRFTVISQEKKKKEDSRFVGSTNKNMQHTLSHPDQQVSWIKSRLQHCLTACALSLLCGEVQTYLFHFCFLTERRRPHSCQGQSSLKKSEVSHRHEIPLKNQHHGKNCASNS